jgi:S1-C subfamily serine protease
MEIARRLRGPLLGGLLGAAAVLCVVRNPLETASTNALQEPLPTWITPEEQQLVSIFERTSRGVVFISNSAVRRDFFSMNLFEVPQGNGSGFVWDQNGHVVTNYHVISGADRISVTLLDQSVFRAKVVGIAPDKDLALLKIEAPPDKLHPVPLGRAEALRVGMIALAIGNPFGLDHSMSRGIISALGREIRSLTGRTITDVIQTDAAINPGNSGGPLLNSQGELIGVNTQIVSTSGTSSGVGFAVPVDTVRRVVEQLLRYGRVIQPGLGIDTFPDSIALQVSRRFNLPRGVLIRNVFSDSAAARSGLRGTKVYRSGEVELGDIIIKVNEHEIRGREDLLNTLERYQVGQEVEVTYRRGNETRKTKVVLQAIE